MTPETMRIIELREQVMRRVQELLVEQLSVRRLPETIDPDAPLFGNGVGLDSVDSIELVIAIETELEVSLPDGEELLSVQRSVNRIVDYVVSRKLAEQKAAP
jgi:acyl carrier protein